MRWLLVLALASSGCASRQRTATALVIGGITAMGVSLFDLRRGPYGPADYLEAAGLGAAVTGLALWPTPASVR
jgi:hypothetical protein